MATLRAEAHGAAGDLASAHTANFPELLRRCGGCLLVSTYQAGKLVILRPDGDAINTHFCAIDRPMGLAADLERIAVGSRHAIREYRNLPAVAARLDDPLRHDAVYLARRTHVTGVIDIHEMAWDGDGELWFVNTLFSCLCTLDERSSFVPRWRPRFVSAYAAEDRCHLNGLAMRDGRVRHVTALGETDSLQGWRADKRTGGVLVDVDSGETIVRGLSMPHSPRWHQGRLWLLESGRGALLQVDPHDSTRREVARLPGFVRGMDFVGDLAFIGLSQLRESNAFTDIPITDDNRDRLSGVWVVDLVSGNTVALLKFTGGVQEIFAVQFLPGILFPELVQQGELLDRSYALPDALLPEVSHRPA